MNSQQNSQDQGFIASKLVARVSEIDDIRDSKGKQCRMFSPFYLPQGQGALKVEIPQAVEDVDEFLIEEEIRSLNKSDMNVDVKNGIKRNNSTYPASQHPYRFYAQNSTFQLVYSKTSSQDPLNNEFQYIKNEIVLQTATDTKQYANGGELGQKTKATNVLRNPYSRLLRSFDYQHALNPSIPRNTSNRSDGSKKCHMQSPSSLLVFDSRFQCGNLYCVYHKVGTNEYHLFLQNDTNSYGYNQWFYFSLTNAKPNVDYHFVIVNLKKKHSFFKQGFKPIVFSLKKYQQLGSSDKKSNGWYRSGMNIDYQQSHIITTKFYKFYKLQFTLKVSHENDYLLVAANPPYSFTKLSNYLEKFARNFKNSNEAQQESIATLRIVPLGRTFCGNNLPEIKITPIQDENNEQQKSSPNNRNNKKKSTQQKKKMIIFLARQHPGETVSSYLMQSILTQLSTFGIQSPSGKQQSFQQKQSKQKIKYLLKNFTILIYPMINIDGVIYGNSRCDVSGMDLNRRWKNPSKVFHPQVFNIKNRLEIYAKKYDVVACFDLHGHSKLFNVFCYGCKIHPVTCRILPFLVSKQTKKFHFPSCTFGITRYKSTTARAAIFKIIQNENVLTIESSYFGFIQNNEHQNRQRQQSLQSTNSKTIIKYFQPKDFQQLAMSLLIGLEVFLNKNQIKKYKEIEKQISVNLREIENFERENRQGKKDSGSQSDPEGDEIEFQVKIKTILGKQFIQQASSFLPAQQQLIELPQTLMKSTNLSQPFSQNNHIKTTQRQNNIDHEMMKESLQKIERSNKIRITKLKPQSKIKRATSNQKNKNDSNILNFKNSEKLTKPQSSTKRQKNSTSLYEKIKQPTLVTREKRIVSILPQKSSDKTQRLYSQNNQRSTLMANKNHSKMRIHDDHGSQGKNSTQIARIYDDLVIYGAQSKDVHNFEKSNLLESSPSISQQSNFTDNHFFIKFKKFMPSHPVPSFNRKQKLSFLEDSIYKDDQREILNTLMQNKRKLQKQKTRREQDKSATIGGQRYIIKNLKQKNAWQEEIEVEQKIMKNFGLSVGRGREQIVDFKRFKDRDKAKLQMRQANQVYIKFMKREP